MSGSTPIFEVRYERLILSTFALLLQSACTVQQPSSSSMPAKPAFERVMQRSGHGLPFDSNGNQVTLSEDAIGTLQKEMLVSLANEPGRQPNAPLDAIAVEAKNLLSTQKVTSLDTIAARGVMIAATAGTLPVPRRDVYLWRSAYLVAAGRTLYPGADVNANVVKLFGRTRLPTDQQSKYIDECRNGDVPIPPDFRPGKSQWTYQGNLTENMLEPGLLAQVWTWADPDRTGACVLLPRGHGGDTDVAGIICQSAKTGQACFWDNIDRSDPGRRIPWAQEPLVLSQIEDARTLSPCTDCHQGNNVFLVSPMDPVWCRLMRGSASNACGPMTGANANNFTLRVFDSKDYLDGHPRYIPLSGDRGWRNAVTTPECSGSCHEMPLYPRRVHPQTSLDGIARDWWMPPGCRYDCYTR